MVIFLSVSTDQSTVSASLRLVRGEEGDAQRLVAIGQRRLELRGGAQACGDAGHHRIGDTGLAQRFDFLAAAAEDEGIAALQPHRALA